MKLAVLSMATLLVWSGCGTAGPQPAGPIALDQAFSLSVGAVAQSGAAGLRVGFDGVSADSRCPKGERCVWAGDAIARVWLQVGQGPRQMVELHTAANAAQQAQALGHELRLVRLDPYPVTGRATAASDYVATLVLSAGSSASAER